MDIRFLKADDATKVDPEGIKWPQDTIVAIAQNGSGEIEGRSAILTLPHIEGTWVAEKHRGTPLAHNLVKSIEGFLKEAGRTHAFAFVDMNQSDVLGYMLRLGYKTVPLIVMTKEI